MKSIAIMQPYFIPYAGYFRLMQAADIFVIYDCVQFARRGYVHRNRLDNGNKKNWLTLPLVKQPRETKINQLAFRTDSLEEFKCSLQNRLVYSRIHNNEPLKTLMYNFEQSPVSYISDLLKYFCSLLNIKTEFIFSSELGLSSQLKGQNRILEICNHLEANHYINSPNGCNLYDANSFRSKDLELSFLNEYQGNYISILEEYFLHSNGKEKHLIGSIKRQSLIT